LVVWRLDRLGRNLQDLIGFVDGLNDGDVQFASLTEQMDTSTNMGRLIFQIFGAMAEYERALIRERAAAGAAAARARGRLGGRPRALTPKKLSTAQALMRDPSISVAQICRTVGVSRRTLYRHLAPDGSLRQPKSENRQ
jgi:DNA invertase Pin-like site-specific DNA recombinase